MTDPTLTPEVYGDFDLHLAAVRKMEAPLQIEVGDVIITREVNFHCIHVQDKFAWCKMFTHEKSVGPFPAYVWNIDGTPHTLKLEDDHYRAIAIRKGART